MIHKHQSYDLLGKIVLERVICGITLPLLFLKSLRCKKLNLYFVPAVKECHKHLTIMPSPIRMICNFLLFLTVSLVTAQEATEAHKDSLNAVVDQYYSLNVQVFQAGSTMEDVEQVFSLFTDDFVYVHPKYGGTYTRQDLYDGYTRNLENGRYNGRVVDIKVLTRITGLNAVVTQKAFVEREDGQITEKEPQMTLFEFRDGKIARISEYW